MSPHDQAALVETGRRVLRLEAAEIARTGARLGEEFAQAVQLLAEAGGRVIVSGIGKSGLIARKIAATLTSTGTPASFLHPVDSLHGDLGAVGREDVAIVVSKSGESGELAGLLAALERLTVPVIAIAGARDSLLSRVARVTLDAGVTEEACPHDLTPTTSTAVALALGDALAVAVLEVKGFGREDFAALHPGGSLGRKLLLRVRDVMIPVRPIGPRALMRDVVVTLAHERGLAVVVEGPTLVGVFSAGDLTRLVERQPSYLEIAVESVMTRSPKMIAPEDLAAAAVGRMERYGIMVLPVLEGDGKVVGVVHLHDLMRAGAV